jgi:DNA-binding MarR family transcriptional regulator
MSKPVEGRGVASAEVGMVVEAVRALSRASRLLERASGELTLSHYRVLSAIASGDERASRIAARLAVGKPTISAIVESLCQRGLLARSTVKGDHRAAALRLTAQGAAVLSRVETEMVARLEGLCSRTPDGGRLIESLVWLGDAIEADAAERQAHVARARG